jgi:uncharacterized tellurite resistance protein B-like protein
MAYLDPKAGARRQDYTEVAIADLTAASGTADGTVADVTASHDQTILNNNFQDLATKVNAILAALRTAGIINP